MTDITAKQEEWAARLLCVADGLDPDENMLPSSVLVSPQWQDPEVLKAGRRLLAELERQGVKVTSHLTPSKTGRQTFWHEDHDAAPICPDAD